MRTLLGLASLLLSLGLGSQAYASDADRAIDAAREARLWEDKQWHRLLHYRSSMFGKFRSEIDREEFFLAKSGKHDAQSELEATIRGIYSTEPVLEGEMHARCKYPARLVWLHERLGLDPAKLPPADCSKFARFLDHTRARSVSVVFSSYYLGNPSSTFGHTFIRLNKGETSQSGERFELLDFGVNFGATVGAVNPVAYAALGMTGGFRGEFTALPYYYKVREYNDFEARDLWSYDLNLTQKQVDLVVAHLFELGSAHFDYYFLDENCSYHVLGALDVADPELDLVGRLPLIVIPADTVRALLQTQGLVKSFGFRPSVRATFEKRAVTLQEPVLGALRERSRNGRYSDIPETFTAEQKAELLDSVADYLDLKFSKDLLDNQSQPSKWKQEVLLTRSALGIPSKPLRIEAPTSDAPHFGHGTKRVTAGGGYHDRHGSFANLGFRFALHDLLDPKVGYPEAAQIEMFTLQARHYLEGNRFGLDDFALFRIVSLPPIDSFNREKAWRVNVGATRFRDRSCDNCFGGIYEMGFGISQKPIRSLPFSYFLLGDMELSAAPRFRGPHFRFGAGPSLGLRFHFSDRLASLVQTGYRYYPFMDEPHSYHARIGARWGFASRFALNLEGAAFPGAAEASAGLMFYY